MDFSGIRRGKMKRKNFKDIIRMKAFKGHHCFHLLQIIEYILRLTKLVALTGSKNLTIIIIIVSKGLRLI